MAGARPATSRPLAKRPSPATYGTPGPRRSASRPATTMPTTLPSMKALNTQPYRSRPPRSRATSGMTVTTASASEAMKVMVSTRPAVSARRGPDHSPPPGSAWLPPAGSGTASDAGPGTGGRSSGRAGDGCIGPELTR